MRGEAVFGSGNPNEDGAVCFPEAEQWYNGIRQRIRELSFPRQHHFSGSRALSALAGRLHFTGRGLKKMSTRCRDDCILIVDVAKCVDDQPGKTNGKGYRSRDPHVDQWQGYRSRDPHWPFALSAAYTYTAALSQLSIAQQVAGSCLIPGMRLPYCAILFKWAKTRSLTHCLLCGSYAP